MAASETEARAPGASLFHQIAYGIGNLPTGLLSTLMGAWLMYYYCPPGDAARPTLVSPGVFGTWLLILSIPSAIADPTVGHLSDRTRSRWGRRIPYVLFGTPVLVLSFVMMWFPPDAAATLTNTIWLIGCVLVYYLAFTAVVNPLLAIMPEVWQGEKARMSTSSLMSIGSAIGTLLASVAGLLIDAWPEARDFLGVGVDGFRATALICGAVTIAATLPTVIWIRETPHSAAKEVPFDIWRSGWETLKNPAFLPYLVSVAFINTSTTLVVALLPYQVKVLANSTEGVAGGLMAGLMVLAMAAMPLTIKAIDRIERRKLYLYCCLGMAVVLTLMFAMGLLPDVAYRVAGLVVPLRLAFVTGLLALAAPFVSVFLVVPRTLLADVMDYDEQRTGYRREAMYNGMESLLGKIPVGLAPFIMGKLFEYCGNTGAQPWGISLSALAASVLTVLAWAAFLKYPLRK